MASIAQVVVRFGVDLKQFTTEMQKATRQIQAMGKQMQSTGKNITQGLTVPLLALGGASVKLASDFDESMTKIQTLVGISADTVEDFKEAVLELSGRTAKAPAELADALFTVTSAGLRGAEALQVLEMAAKGSAVGMGETKEIARAVTAVMQAYGPETMSAAKAMDILTATVREGNLEASELAPVLGRVVGIAAQLGVGFEEVGASIATFTRLGVDSSEAVTGLSGFLNALIKPSKEGADALATVGMSFADLRREVDDNGLASTMIKLLNTFDGNVEALGDVIPNVRALGAVMGTAGVQAQAYLSIQDNIANSAGILNKAFEDTSKSGAFRLKEAFNTLKQIGTDIGGSVLPVVAKLADNVRDLFRRFANLNEGTKETIIKVAAFAAAIGPALYVVGSMITSIGALTKAMRVLGVFIAANPWLALAGAIGAVVAGFMAWNGISKQVESSSVSQAKKVRDEQNELNNLVNTISRLNEDNETRKLLLDELKQKYPDFISKLGNEQLTNENLQKALRSVNSEYAKKIAFIAAEEELTKNLQEQKEIADNLVNLEKELTTLRAQQNTSDSMQGQELIQGQINATTSAIDLNKISLQNLQDELANTKKSYEDLAMQMASATGGVSVVPSAGGFGKDEERKPFTGAAAQMKELIPLVNEVTGEVEGMGVSFQQAFGEVESGAGVLENVFSSITGSIAQSFTDMLTGAKFSIKGIIQVILQLIAKLAAAAIAAAVLSALIPGGQAKLGQAGSAATTFGSLFKSFAGFRAAGGPVSAGSSYIVGERGPELFSPSSSGMITPNHMLGGGSAQKMQLQVVGSVPIRFMPDGSLSAVLAQEQIRFKKLGG